MHCELASNPKTIGSTPIPIKLFQKFMLPLRLLLSKELRTQPRSFTRL
jgi:hypothetical protein